MTPHVVGCPETCDVLSPQDRHIRSALTCFAVPGRSNLQARAATIDNPHMNIQLERVLSSDRLPSLPAVALRVVQLAQQAEPDFAELVRTIKSDQAISGKILKTANSALFGLRQRASSIEAAVPLLGAKLVRTLVLGFQLARLRSPDEDLADAYQSSWRSSLTQAVAAETIASHVTSADPAVFFTAGLLQDIGILALLQTYPREYLAALSDDGVSNSRSDHNGGSPSPLDIEKRVLEFTHVDVSVRLCQSWGLDDDLVQAISTHHDSPNQTQRLPASSQPLALALMVAAECAEYLESIRGNALAQRSKLDGLLAKHYQLENAEIVDFLREVTLRVGEMAAIFSVDVGEMTSVDDIVDRARVALEEIAVQSQVEALVVRRKVDQAVRRLKEVESQRDQLRDDAYRDPLTGAYNRRFMSSLLELELEQCTEDNSAVGLLFLDIDQFKQLNDNHGHALGDQVLQAVSQVLHQSIRQSDLVVRYGGDEFLVLLIKVSRGEVRRIARRICRRVHKTRLESDRGVRLSTSVGALYYAIDPDESLDVAHLIREVDGAMYEAKRQGGNCVHLCEVEKTTLTS